MSRLGALLTMQRLDEELAHHRAEVAALEAALARDEELERRRARADAARQERMDADLAARQAEGEAADVRQRAARLEKRLYDGSVGNPQELMGMQAELGTLKQKLDDAETSLLERMEEADAAGTAFDDATSAVQAREQERESEHGPRTVRLGELRAAAAELEAARGEAVADLDAADLRTYERVAAKRTPAVVRLAGESCGGCHLPIGISEARAVKAGSVVQCSNCDRILVP
jgi:predicted  nucleic acid-binding Zn-ribbon protein